MKKLLILLIATGLVASSCRKIQVDERIIDNSNNGGIGNENLILEGRIAANKTLKAGLTYKLRGLVYVTNGAILTIEPGTRIVGESGKNGGLIITRSSKIIADGTVDKPIVFTSESATPRRGDWAGVVILGNAPTNASFNGIQGVGEIEGGINNSDGLGLYGTPITQAQNPADNSGILRYVRIEYAGYAFLPDKEVNGLTLAGVGNQTIVDYVEVAYSNDDSFEWFGGTVNCKHLISYKALDDDFDTDNGYSGKVQFGIVLRDSAIADISKSEAFESDNDANGSTLTPQTTAVFSNMTVLGPRAEKNNIGNSLFLAGAQMRRNSSLSIFNSIIAGWPAGIMIDASKGAPTDLNITGQNPTLLVQNTIIAGCAQPVIYVASATTPTGATNASIVSWFSNGNSNTIFETNKEVELLAPFNYSNPDFNPAANSPASNGATYAHAKLAGFQQVNYKGACAPGDTWWKGWTIYQ